MEGITAEERTTDVVPGSSPATDSPGTFGEPKPADEIAQLWTVHVQAKGVVRKTREEMKAVRQRLSERLSEIKPLLVRPGRSGQWSAWLKERGISRASADGLVRRYAAALPGHESTHEEISNPPDDSAENLAKVVWSRLKKVLATDQSAIDFIGCLVTASGVAHEQRDDGLVIFNPVPKAADQLSDSAPATDPIPQPCDEASNIAAEPPAEASAAIPATEQAAGDGDVCAEAVV
ncbi:MAG: hypothetical protein ABSB82_08015 [Terriglobia bacterium]